MNSHTFTFLDKSGNQTLSHTHMLSILASCRDTCFSHWDIKGTHVDSNVDHIHDSVSQRIHVSLTTLSRTTVVWNKKSNWYWLTSIFRYILFIKSPIKSHNTVISPFLSPPLHYYCSTFNTISYSVLHHCVWHFYSKDRWTYKPQHNRDSPQYKASIQKPQKIMAFFF